MFARKGITAAVAASRSNLLAAARRCDQPILRTTRIASFSSSLPRSASQVPEPLTRVPRPIPLDIGNGPAAAATAASAETGASGRHYKSSSSGSIFDRFGEPIINVIIYSSAASLAVHLLYNYLALEEYRISSDKRIADLEAEITAIKSNVVRHTPGGRGEFV
ncbi:hypothetical protein B0O80DRAFT_498639 [Mortierella sp. GBAus27b]|nr:hypothetical protein BGX31_002055 [Mortierella sp. GBA43]KAI8353783.1 hypothetical protein B0O80DRAFT_498639 [Mortierella sp. GBAus27b]